jgi:hypothetical protein
MGEVTAGYYFQATEDHNVITIAGSGVATRQKIKGYQMLYVGGLQEQMRSGLRQSYPKYAQPLLSDM